jgi:two-component system KDP operon response regulator KdpE
MSAQLPTILIADDEPQIRRLLRIALESQKYRVLEAADGRSALEQAALAAPDLLILDLGLPDFDGKEVLNRLRGWSSLPVLILSVRDQDSEKVAALDAGADDFVTKPFSMAELLARVRAALRHGVQKTGETPLIRLPGLLEIDLVRRSVHKAGQPVALTPKEYDLLATLAGHRGRVLTHQQLLRQVWGPAHSEDLAYLRVFIRQLRRKIEPDPAAPTLITTESGIGYRLNEAADDVSGRGKI